MILFPNGCSSPGIFKLNDKPATKHIICNNQVGQKQEDVLLLKAGKVLIFHVLLANFS
ncbi:hypothetical protein [Flavisolibacter ginsengisoli]|jgi:hypothetical protein|uniref:Uncharacterized protein n=1 Tax=Flavisolibacter ginsengisoli DSM 18119 TaxID=1121884 RepID=A0A1M4T7E6_9BACT|nr:hypothetical protein [Flavisolibacter ginsengisoli]SHE40320.1 hypothetical protein SAMN02745131_00368 [Flavisolibacter ginsengisoli DSM 18119]